MKQYTDSFALWQDMQKGLLVANRVADVPGIWKIHNKETLETMFTFSDETENLDPCLELTVEAALQRRKWHSRYILGSTHGHQVNWELKVWIARAIRNNPADGPVILSVEQINALMEEVELAHSNGKMLAVGNLLLRERNASLTKTAADFKQAVRLYTEMVAQHAPMDDTCMCGNQIHKDGAGCDGHSPVPMFQYHEGQAREAVESFFPRIEGGDGPHDRGDDTDLTQSTVEHTDLQGNVAQVNIPSKAEKWEGCSEGHHQLYTNDDDKIPPTIVDRNGDVVLDLCKVCGLGEQELLDTPVCPGPREGGPQVYFPEKKDG